MQQINGAAGWTKCNMKRVQHEKYKYRKRAQKQCTIVHKRIAGRPLRDCYTLVLREVKDKWSDKVARSTSWMRLYIFVKVHLERFFFRNITHFFRNRIRLTECATFRMCKKLEPKDFSWTYTMIKAKQYSVAYLWKIEFDAKTGWWKCQDFNIRLTLNVKRIDMWLILWIC